MERLRGFHLRMREELGFSLKLDHYHDDDPTNRDPHRIQPRGRELKELIVDTASDILNAKIYLSVRPEGSGQQQMEPETAEIAEHAIEGEIYNPDKCYEEIRERVVMGGLAARMWCAFIGYDADIGPFGEIYFESFPGNQIMWAPGYASPHDIRCPWVIRWFLMDTESIENMAGWKDNKDMPKPGDKRPEGTDMQYGVPRLDIEMEDEGKTIVCMMWERGVKDTVKMPQPGTLKELDPTERYMGCLQCGWQGPRQGGGEEELPEESQCPECGQMAYRVDAEEVEVEKLAYQKGRRFSIFAPYARREFVDLKKWPHDLTTLPLIVFQPDPHPEDPVGGSMTFDHKTMQLSADMTLRLGLEHMVLAKPYMVMGRGMTDLQGEAWQGGDDQGLWIMAPDDVVANRMQMVQAAGMPPALPALSQLIDAKFMGHTGTPKINLTPQNSKDIAASTLAQYIQQGQKSVQRMLAIWRREEGRGINALYQLIRAVYTDGRWTAYQGQEGQWAAMLIRGDNLPNARILISADPSETQRNLEDLQTWERFAQAPPPYREFYAKKLNIPISEVRELEQKEQEWQQQQMAMQAQQQQQAAAQQQQMASQQMMQQADMDRQGAMGREASQARMEVLKAGLRNGGQNGRK